MFLLKKFFIGQKKKKNGENCRFLLTIFLSHENLVQKILFAVKPASCLFGGLTSHGQEKMHINLPYPNIFTRKKNDSFFVLGNFFSKNQFFDIFSSYNFKKTSKLVILKKIILTP